VKLRFILGFSVAMVVGCSGIGDERSGSANAPASATSAPVSASPAASRVADIVVGGARPVTIHVPAGYDANRPAPLLIVLHGYSSSGKGHDAYFHLGQAAQQRGFLYAYPDGTVDSSGNHFWNSTDACCDFDPSGVDDAAYLAGVIAEARSSLAVDPRRIYLIGHSNGAFMSYAVACAQADQIAAIVSLAGATFVEPADCVPADPVAVLQIHGTADDTIAFKGGQIVLGGGRSMAPYPGAETSVATWATYDGCTGSSVVDEHVDVDADLSDHGSPAEASVTRWTGCKPGGAVELWTVPNGRHSPNISASFPAAVLDFFEAHGKP
jgi:polyhydroxybutyrate depolymerase